MIATQPLRSRLYSCTVAHRRFAPKAHAFSYRLFYLAVDLDELPALQKRLHLFSVNARNLYSLRERDYLPFDGRNAEGATTLRDRVRAFLAAHDVTLGDARVELITLPRTLGYLFNPVSFYFCSARDTGAPLAAIAEVTNTFGEVKPFFVGPEKFREGAFRLRVPKFFYVSPFSDIDVEFDFVLRPAGERLAIQIDDYENDRRTLTSVVAGKSKPLTDVRLAWYLVRFPLVTLRVITLIHWHALRLWLKRVPWFAKAARAADQRNLYRPHILATETTPKILPTR